MRATDTRKKPAEARSVLIVDEKANDKARASVSSPWLAELGGQRLFQVVEVKTSRISFKIEAPEEGTPEEGHWHTGCPILPAPRSGHPTGADCDQAA